MTIECSLTIVIPTLGGGVLAETVRSIMAGSVVPKKILIVIPEDRVGYLPQLIYKNIEVLVTNFRGQVQQRIFGFSKAQTDFVMQLDDDILLDANCLRYLLNRCSLEENSAVGPMLIDAKTFIPIYEKTKKGFKVYVNKKFYESKTVLIATGTEVKKLNIPGESEFNNKGVHYCALCDGYAYQDKIIAVIGGSDSAAKEALVLSEYGKKVYLIYRGSEIHPEPINLERIKKRKRELKST